MARLGRETTQLLQERCMIEPVLNISDELEQKREMWYHSFEERESRGLCQLQR